MLPLDMTREEILANAILEAEDALRYEGVFSHEQTVDRIAMKLKDAYYQGFEDGRLERKASDAQ